MDNNQWQCHTCDQVFETRGKRDSHQRKKHQKIAITDNEQVIVGRSATSKEFCCPCGKTFPYAHSLKRHTKTCKGTLLTRETDMVVDHAHEREGILL